MLRSGCRTRGITVNEEEEKMLDEALAAESGLSGWELDFLDNINKVFRKKELSERQHDKLQEIVDKL